MKTKLTNVRDPQIVLWDPGTAACTAPRKLAVEERLGALEDRLDRRYVEAEVRSYAPHALPVVWLTAATAGSRTARLLAAPVALAR